MKVKNVYKKKTIQTKLSLFHVRKKSFFSLVNFVALTLLKKKKDNNTASYSFCIQIKWWKAAPAIDFCTCTFETVATLIVAIIIYLLVTVITVTNSLILSSALPARLHFFATVKFFFHLRLLSLTLMEIN